MSPQTGACEAITAKATQCRNKAADGRFCHHHEHQWQCLGWTRNGPCEQRAVDGGGYCPDHTD